MERFLDRLEQIVDREQILLNEPMKKHTTFKVGGPADIFVQLSNADELREILSSAKEYDMPVYIIGNAQKLGAFDLKTGAVQFIQNIGGQNTPVVSGNALFMITTQNTLVALDKKSGALIWETSLVSEEKKGVAWKGPVLAQNQLIVVSNKGDVQFFNAVNGEKIKAHQTDELSNKPILGDGKMILYTNDADLIAYQ